MVRHGLSDEQWECIRPCFPRPARTGRPPSDPRRVMDAILWMVRTGAPWRDLPEEFGPWETVYGHFNRWSSSGLLDDIPHRLKSGMAEAEEMDHELWAIDGTIVRAARCATGGGKKGIPANRRTMHWAAVAGGFPRKSTSSATAKGSPCTSK